MGKTDKLDITFSSPMGVFFSGDILKGNVNVEIIKDIKIRGVRLKLYGKANVHWKDSKGKSGRMVYYRAEEDYFEEEFELFGQGKHVDVILPKGSHTFPFQLPLPATLPSSFEGSFGFVRYVAMATVDLPLKIDYVTKSAFTVLSQLDLNLEPESLKNSVGGRDESSISCFCLASGSLSAEFSINKTGFVPGESIIITGEVRNDTNIKVDVSKAALHQHVEYYGIPDTMFSSKELKPTVTTDVIATVEQGGIAPKTSQTWQGVALEIPSIPPSRLGGCEIINIFYTVEIQVTCKYGGTIHLSTDIVIGTIPFASSESNHVASNQSLSGKPETDGRNGNTEGVKEDSESKTASGGEKENLENGGGQLDGTSKQTSGPTADSGVVRPNLVESSKGRVMIKDKTDSRNTKGKLSWAPLYQMYKFSNVMQATVAASAAREAESAAREAESAAKAADLAAEVNGIAAEKDYGKETAATAAYEANEPTNTAATIVYKADNIYR